MSALKDAGQELNEKELACSLEILEKELDQIQQGQVFEYLSRWSFERLLDQLATCLWRFLKVRFTEEFGCSILYRTAENKTRYVLGGSSTRRTNMDPSARYYDVHEAKGSFTAWSLRHAEPLVFDDFQHAKADDNVTHVSKACELGEAATRSYLTIPRLQASMLASALERAAENTHQVARVDAAAVDDSNLPSCLLRVTFAAPNCATPALMRCSTGGGAALLKLFDIVDRGMLSALNHEGGAIAIADLNANLLRYSSSEYKGLDELAFHLQTLFGECECSIFLAHVLSTEKDKKEARLHLAATTAWSPSGQHQKFRRAFFDERKAYVCPLQLDSKKPEDVAAVSKMAKTERAYHQRDQPVYQPNCDGASRFHGYGEFAESRSFLALAIPARQSDRHPYGVIRLVRGNEDEFSAEDKRLAGAIAKNLTYWLEFFPRNDGLTVTWSDPSLRVDTLRTLFAIEDDLPRNSEMADQERARRLKEAEIEFEGFLRKVFAKSTKVTIKKQFGGYSGAIVLLVENDSGLDLILKCARKGPNESDNVIIQEVENYREFVEGKLALNHNVIYPELIRETRSINGFATTFLGSSRRDRMTVRDFVLSELPAAAIFATIRVIVSKIVEEVWLWWYRPDHRKAASTSVEEFVRDGLRGNVDWYTTKDGFVMLDSSVFDASHKLGRKYPERSPSKLWSEFGNWATKAGSMSWEEGITHGDLHGGNIFFEPDSMEVWVIDFARTGKRASIADLAALEVNIKLQLLPLVLRHKELVKDKIAFLQRFEQIERTFASQVDYDVLKLPSISYAEADPNGRALETLRDAVHAVTQIRQLLHQALGRRGRMTDYRIALYLLSHWYMGVRGASDHDKSSLQVLMAYTSVRELVDSLSGDGSESGS